ncbi:hypothetical protein QVD17_07095 [Tagetes erecta]|uniref:Replication factor A C-terminal domain-containing protein n=1 Tax=Tagetes erecta TaxID=13708 RepID=A0AAD8LLX9_TARER|nr:hypothetical protein QVD17_07095 [Tagetes erecta]
MEHNNITLIKNIHLTNDDLTLKLRIVRLWKLPDHINKKEVYSIEMILMDEEGTKITGTVSKRFLSKFTRLLNENINIFVIKPNFGSVRSSYKGQVMSVTLFADYAEKFIEYLQKNPEEVRYKVILQFGRIKWFQATDDELFLKTEFINIEEVSEIKEEKHVVILATIISFIEDKPWGYFGCTKCYKKVEPVILIDDKPKSHAEVDEPTIYHCTKCLIDVRIPIPRFRIEIRVQDHTRVLSLTLFDREAKKILKVSAKDLIGSQSKQVIESNQEVSDFYAYPPLLTTLLQRKFAFKIEISKFVFDHSLSVYGINKISADDSMISQLNQKVDREQFVQIVTPAESDSQRVTYMFVASQDTTTMKDVVSTTDDNVTPASHTEKSTATSPLVRAKNSAVSSTSSDLKHNLSDAYDVNPPTANLTTKKDRSSVSSGQADQVKLLVPKVEKLWLSFTYHKSLTQNVDSMLIEKHNLNVQLMELTDKLNNVKDVQSSFVEMPIDVREKMCTKECFQQCEHYRTYSFRIWDKFKDEEKRHKNLQEQHKSSDQRIACLQESIKKSEREAMYIKNEAAKSNAHSSSVIKNLQEEITMLKKLSELVNSETIV